MMKLAFRLLLTIAVWGGSTGVVARVPFERAIVAAEQETGPPNEGRWTQLRKEAAHRQRRIIFNNDGDDAVYYCKQATPEALLDCRTSALVGTQVDTIFYCTWCSGFSNFTHNTTIGQVFTSKEDKLSNNKVDQFIKQGTDPLKIMIDFCHAHRIEIFWSCRMNDTHDASTAWYGPLLFPQLKKDHPDWLLGTKEQPTKYGRWTGVDYGRREIRELAFCFVEEVCRGYDVDGVELDFFRHLNYFKPVSRGARAGAAEREMMTGLVRRIRQMTERVGCERGRPILIATRLPDSVEYCSSMGLDLARWLEEGLIDLLVVGGYFRLNPWETSVALGHAHGVPVYPCLSEPRLKGEAGTVRSSPECYRARAVNVWAAGADGVYLFNFFNPKSPLWSELGDPEVLQTMDKVFTTGARGVTTAGTWLAGGAAFLNRSLVSPESPRTLEPGEATTVELEVGQQLVAGESKAAPPDALLRLQVDSLSDPEQLSVKFNGHTLGPASMTGQWLEFVLAADLVNKGVNRVQITLDAHSQPVPVVRDLLLGVRYKK